MCATATLGPVHLPDGARKRPKSTVSATNGVGKGRHGLILSWRVATDAPMPLACLMGPKTLKNPRKRSKWARRGPGPPAPRDPRDAPLWKPPLLPLWGSTSGAVYTCLINLAAAAAQI